MVSNLLWHMKAEVPLWCHDVVRVGCTMGRHVSKVCHQESIGISGCARMAGQDVQDVKQSDDRVVLVAKGCMTIKSDLLEHVSKHWVCIQDLAGTSFEFLGARREALNICFGGLRHLEGQRHTPTKRYGSGRSKD